MKRLFSLCIYAALFSSVAMAQETPRLVVGITIDQLRGDYLESFAALYGEDGLKRLMRDGLVYRNAKYPFRHINKSAASTTVVTGTVPYTHGIVSDEWVNRKTLQTETCVDDKNFSGVNTRMGASAANVLVSTIGDELKIATEGKGFVYSIGTDRLISVLSAGHAADWAMWIDKENGRWAGTKYYGDRAPYWVNPLEYEERMLSDRGSNNARVTRAARFCLTSGACGADHITDFVALNYSVAETTNAGIDRIRENYVALDMEIAKLLEVIERSVGIDKTLIYLTSTGYEDAPTLLQTISYKLPTQEFSMNRCVALLNMYLVALHGKGNYIETHLDNQLYLDKKLLEQKHLKFSDVLQECEDFLYQFDGVKEVYTSTRLLQGAWSPGLSIVRNGFNIRHSGDILIEIIPGCSLADDSKSGAKVWRPAWVNFPIIYYGYNFEAKQVYDPVSTEQIAPTIASHARIRAPNGIDELNIKQ